MAKDCSVLIKYELKGESIYFLFFCSSGTQNSVVFGDSSEANKLLRRITMAFPFR